MKRVRRKTKRKTLKVTAVSSGLKLGDRITLDDYANRIIKPMFPITDYDPDKEQKLKQYCIEQALKVERIDENGNRVQPDIIKTAQKIYDWVTK